MKQEDKELLLKAICAMLPYDLWVDFMGNKFLVTGYGHGRVSLLSSPFSSAVGPCPLIEEVKPYLRPISSMTESEIEEHEKTFYLEYSVYGTPYDWLNTHHIDYRGLIGKGLALEAPEEMYKTKF